MAEPAPAAPVAGACDDGHRLVEALIAAPGWEGVALDPMAERAARATLSHLGLNPQSFEIALLATDDAGMIPLNDRFRGKPVATNVLSWPALDLRPPQPGDAPPPPGPDPFGEEPQALGDIALALETCTREASAAGRPLLDHLAHLVVHGCLHLLGFDHETEQDALLMERIEVEVLATLGVPDPY
ncbi:MAG: rRNA maturation RNase YbeY [Rhodobacteraceae bacterium]|nr:rRNA maturation RNase YbeY [Paracoccaceae bacterium]